MEPSRSADRLVLSTRQHTAAAGSVRLESRQPAAWQIGQGRRLVVCAQGVGVDLRIDGASCLGQRTANPVASGSITAAIGEWSNSLRDAVVWERPLLTVFLRGIGMPKENGGSVPWEDSTDLFFRMKSRINRLMALAPSWTLVHLLAPARKTCR